MFFYQDLADIHKKLAQASGLTVRLLVADDEEVNAYATEEKDQHLVVLNWGLIDALQNDRDAIAAVLAHEYAHQDNPQAASVQFAPDTKARVPPLMTFKSQATGGLPWRGK